MMDKLISEADLAGQLGVSIWCLKDWGRRGYGPTRRRLGKRVYYDRSEVSQFIDQVRAGAA